MTKDITEGIIPKQNKKALHGNILNTLKAFSVHREPIKIPRVRGGQVNKRHECPLLAGNYIVSVCCALGMCHRRGDRVQLGRIYIE